LTSQRELKMDDTIDLGLAIEILEISDIDSTQESDLNIISLVYPPPKAVAWAMAMPLP